MSDLLKDPFANAQVVEDDNDPFANAIVVGGSDVIEAEEKEEVDTSTVFDDLSLMGTAVELPDPSTQMYSDIDNEGEGFSGSFAGRGDAMKKGMERYNFYKNHPESTIDLKGQVKYKGKRVPFPEQKLFSGDLKVGFQQKVMGGIQDGFVNLLESGETLTDLAGITDPKTTYIADNFSKLDTGDSTLDSVIKEGAGLIAGGGAFAKVFGLAAKKLPKLNNVMKTLGFELGVATTAEKDAGTLIIGNKAMLSDLGMQPTIFKGLDVNSEDPSQNQELAQRVNILMDGLTGGKAIEMGIQGTVFVTRTIYNIFVDPLARAGSVSRREEDFVRDVMAKISNVGNDSADIEKAQKAIIKLIEENKDLYVDLPPELASKVDITVDTMTALERALADSDTTKAQDILMSARKIRSGVINQAEGTNQTNIASSGPGNELERVLEEAEVNLGGGDAIKDANVALQRQGTDFLDDAAVNVKTAESNLENLNARVVQELTEDPSVIGRVTSLESKYGFDIGSVKNQSADEIVANLSKASESMDQTKNDLFAAVVGGEVDYLDLISTLKSLKPGQLDAAAAAMPGNSQFGTLLEQIKLKTKMVDDKPVRETVEEMQERFVKWSTQNDLDFARLFTDIRPGLVDSINSLELGSAAEKGAAKTLIQFKKWIDEDAIKFLEDQDIDAETLDAAQEAMRYFKEDWAPFWDDGSTLQQIGTLRRQTIGRGKQEPMFTDTSRNLVEGTINDSNRSVASNMIDLLGRPEGGESAGLVVDFVIGDVLTKLSARIGSSDNVADLGLGAVRQELSQYATLIRENFAGEADRLDALVARLGDNKVTKEALEKELVQAQRLADEAKDTIYKQELNKFFTANGVPNPNGYDTMSKIFSGQQNANQIEGLMARAEADPIIKDGMQAAYTRWFKNQFLGSTTSNTGERALKLSVDTANVDGVKNAFEYAEIVFADKPKFVEALDTLLGEAGLVQRGKGGKAISTGSNTAELTEQVAAVNRGITATLGVLSRLGARVRAASSGYLQKNFDETAYFSMVDSLMANPDEFIAVAERVIDADKKAQNFAIKLPFASGKKIPSQVPFLGDKKVPTLYINKKAAYMMMVKAGIYREGNEEDERSFLEQLSQMELDVSRKTNEVLQSEALQLQ